MLGSSTVNNLYWKLIIFNFIKKIKTLITEIKMKVHCKKYALYSYNYLFLMLLNSYIRCEFQVKLYKVVKIEFPALSIYCQL